MALLPHQGDIECWIQSQEAAAQTPASSHPQVIRSKPDAGEGEPGGLCSSHAMAKSLGEPRETSSPLCSLSPKATVFVFIAGTTVDGLVPSIISSCPSATASPVQGDPELPGVTARLCCPVPPPSQAQQPTEEIPGAQGKLGAKSGMAPHCCWLIRDVQGSPWSDNRARDLPVLRSTC